MKMRRLVMWVGSWAIACGGAGDDGTGSSSGSESADTGGSAPTGGETSEPPPPTCEAVGGSATVAAPELLVTLKDRYEEAWLASPAIADLDGDGVPEIVVPRGEAVLAWHADGTLLWKAAASGRVWASPVVADFTGDGKLEVAFASRAQVHMLDAAGAPVPGFPVSWQDELRSLAAGDLDGDGDLDLVAALASGGPEDVVHAWDGQGQPVAGFPPNASGSSGCDEQCHLAGCYDQNLAVGDLDGDGKADLVAPHDNAYASIHRGSGEAFDAAAPPYMVKKTPGVRYLHALAESVQGYADDEATALQAHFTNTAPAIADIDGDGTREVILLASVQNAAQDQREQGVALWVVGPDAARRPGFAEPVHFPGYRSGLWDYGDNIVAVTNSVGVADISAEPGLEIVFADFDGTIHAVSAAGETLWSYTFTSNAQVVTAGVAIADLSGDGSPEIVFNTYSTADALGELVILNAQGGPLHAVALPRRGAMPVPTIGDVDGDGVADIVVSLKDAEDKVESVLVYRVPGSAMNCLPWPTGRGNSLRSGLVP
jgi:hypothetical protein